MSSSSPSFLLPPLPKPISILSNLLSSNEEEEQERPTKLEITILHLNVDDDNDTFNCEKSFVKVGPHLGINANDLPYLASEFRMDYRHIRKYIKSIRHSGELTKACHARVLITTSCLLLVCPDNATAWADRKRAILHFISEEIRGSQKKIDILKSELDFLNLLFTQHSKAVSSWAHRKYISGLLLQIYCNETNSTNNFNSMLDWLEKEIKVCIEIAESFPKNYYAWTHRLYCMKIFLSKTSSSSPTIVHELLEREIYSTTPWLKKHVSDHSSVNYGIQVLKLYTDNSINNEKYYHRNNYNSANKLHSLNIQLIQKVLYESIHIEFFHFLCQKHQTYKGKNKVTMTQNASMIFASHEVIWIYRRLCSYMMIVSIQEYWHSIHKHKKNFSITNSSTPDKNIGDTITHQETTTDTSEIIKNIAQEFIEKEIWNTLSLLQQMQTQGDMEEVDERKDYDANTFSSFFVRLESIDDDKGKSEIDQIQKYAKSYILWVLYHIEKEWKTKCFSLYTQLFPSANNNEKANSSSNNNFLADIMKRKLWVKLNFQC